MRGFAVVWLGAITRSRLRVFHFRGRSPRKLWSAVVGKHTCVCELQDGFEMQEKHPYDSLKCTDPLLPCLVRDDAPNSKNSYL